MEVVLAKNAGFCMGVRRAVDTTLGMVQKGETTIATFGPLIHNPQVLKLLEEQGVRILTEIPVQATGSIIIRAHGIPPDEKKKLEATGARVEDATCPRVLKVQAIIARYKKEGFATVIIGDRDHAERRIRGITHFGLFSTAGRRKIRRPGRVGKGQGIRPQAAGGRARTKPEHPACVAKMRRSGARPPSGTPSRWRTAASRRA